MNGKQLKNSILQWAIQGKLVPQDPNDEPASVLLERIRAEKARLVKEGKIKKDKNESIIFRGDDNSHYEKFLATGAVKCIDDEIPFEIPDGWEWCRLNDLALYRKGPFGSSLTKSMFVARSNQSFKVYEQKNAIQKDFRLGDYYISKKKFEAMQSFIVKPNDIIVSCAGTIGETYLLPLDAPAGIINQALMKVTLFDLSMAEYWQMYFAYMLLNEVQMKGAGSAIKNIPPFEYLKAVLVPVPPLSEQNRLVERYNLLLSLIVKYESEADKLNCLNLNIYDKLKKTVLHEAIQGKLVQQIAEEGTAQELLEQIKAEKEKLVKEGKLKKSALNNTVIFRGDDNKYWEKKGTTCECIDEDIPFDVPKSWAWVRLETILNTGSARRVHAKDWRQAGIPFYRAREIGKLADDGFVDNELYIDLSLYEDFSSSGVPLPNDLMITAVGTLGKVYIVKENDKFYYKDGSVLCLANKYGLCAEYLKMVIESPSFKGQYRQESQGTTVATLTMVRLQKYFIPLPPLQEQYRIVETYRNIASIMS